MDFAIIIQKNHDGTAARLRSTIQPPTARLEAQARITDTYLQEEIPAIEQRLIKGNLLQDQAEGTRGKRGTEKVDLWHELGNELRKVCAKLKVAGQRERRWLWEALENIYATEQIKRAQRGKTRNHFEYCYRLAGFQK